MGFKTQSTGEGFKKFQEGDNVLLNLKSMDTKYNPEKQAQGDDDEEPVKYELEMKFDAVHEADSDERGLIAYWPNSLITVSDNENYSSNLAKLLQKAGILKDVVSDLPGSNESLVEAVANGDKSYRVETDEENIELMKAISKNYPQDKVLRASTTQVKGNYSRVERVLGITDSDVFDDEDSEASVEDDGGDDDVLFDEDEDEEDLDDLESGEEFAHDEDDEEVSA